jgi:hypothetical protein
MPPFFLSKFFGVHQRTIPSKPPTKFLQNKKVVYGSRDNSVGIVIGYGIEGRVSIPSRGKVFFFSTAF